MQFSYCDLLDRELLADFASDLQSEDEKCHKSKRKRPEAETGPCWGAVAPMIKIAETPRRVVIICSESKTILNWPMTHHHDVLPLGVELLDPVERVLAELDLLGGWPAPLVLVRRDVNPMGLQVAQAVSCYLKY